MYYVIIFIEILKVVIDMLEQNLLEEARKEYNLKKEISLISDKEKNDLVSDLENHPHAFVLACFMDRQIPSERAWSIPYLIKEILGDFSINTLYNLSLEEYRKIFNENKFHRYNDVMAEVFYNAVKKIVEEYNGNASNIWNNEPSSSMIVSRFLDFDGVGIKIATMATNILASDFKIKLADYYSIDISPDIHIKRVFKRMGFIKKKDINNIEKIIYKAKTINPTFPGIIDYTCWKLGKDTCRPTNPKCNECIFKEKCPKIIDNSDF